MSLVNNWTSLSYAMESVDPNCFLASYNLHSWLFVNKNLFLITDEEEQDGDGDEAAEDDDEDAEDDYCDAQEHTFGPQWSPPPPTRAAPVATFVTGFHSAAHAVSPPRVHRPPDPSGPMTLLVVPASRRQWRHRITAIPSRVRRSGETVSSSRRLTHCVWLVSCWFDCRLWVVWLAFMSCWFDCRLWVIWLPLVSCLIAVCELSGCRLWVVCLIAVCELFDCRLWVVCLIAVCELCVWLPFVSCVFDCFLWVVWLPFVSCLFDCRLWVVFWLLLVSCLFDCCLWVVWLLLVSCLFDCRL